MNTKTQTRVVTGHIVVGMRGCDITSHLGFPGVDSPQTSTLFFLFFIGFFEVGV